ncbi:hypothetical protein [Actinosynnema sp. NPDC020468]|uniref:hypothetical protein n=1 Tax=Actinosynnema sp. NPDC020468 TaxID=3154488 RepID=UPI00340E3AE6
MTEPPQPPRRTVRVVILNRVASGGLTAVSGSLPVDLCADRLSNVALEELLDSSAELSAPDGVPDEVVRDVCAMAAPPLLSGASWLRHHRALVFQDGVCRVGAWVLRYSEERGVRVDGYL